MGLWHMVIPSQMKEAMSVQRPTPEYLVILLANRM